jgi:hypothetical protein
MRNAIAIAAGAALLGWPPRAAARRLPRHQRQRLRRHRLRRPPRRASTSRNTGWARTPGRSRSTTFARLIKAVAEAPSGQLYQDLSGMQQLVDEGVGADTLVTGAYRVSVERPRERQSGG